MTNELQTIDEHSLIREVSSYSLIEQIEVSDLPNVLKFLKIVSNYSNMIDLLYSKI